MVTRHAGLAGAEPANFSRARQRAEQEVRSAAASGTVSAESFSPLSRLFECLFYALVQFPLRLREVIRTRIRIEIGTILRLLWDGYARWV